MLVAAQAPVFFFSRGAVSDLPAPHTRAPVRLRGGGGPLIPGKPLMALTSLCLCPCFLAYLQVAQFGGISGSCAYCFSVTLRVQLEVPVFPATLN